MGVKEQTITVSISRCSKLRWAVYAYLCAYDSMPLENKEMLRILKRYAQEESVSFTSDDLDIIDSAAKDAVEYLDKHGDLDVIIELSSCGEDFMAGLLCFGKDDKPCLITVDKFRRMSLMVSENLIPELLRFTLH